MIVLFVLLCAVGLVVAGHCLVCLPDHDRPLAYPGEPRTWGDGQVGTSCGWRRIVGSALFWALCAMVAGATGTVLSAITGRAPWLNAAVALASGIAVAAMLCWLIGRRLGSEMLCRLPDQRRDEPCAKPRVLFVCGSINQTTQMHQIAEELPEVQAHFTPYFSDHWGWVLLRKLRLLESSILGYKRRALCLQYLTRNGLNVDLHGERYDYDLVLLPNDQIIAPGLRGRPIVLVQEGIQDPPNLRYLLWRHLRLVHRAAVGTSTFGLSLAYDKFCVASEGYRDHFIELGVPADKLVVTGMPNFDDCQRYYDNDFPYRDYVLACTTDARETLAGSSSRQRFLREVVEIAAGRQLIFKLHPNERHDRATREIKRVAPDALVFTEGSAEQMVANCSVLITEWSTLTFVGAALGKQVHSHHPMDKIMRLLPLQNGCAALNIADVCRDVLRLGPAAAQQPGVDQPPITPIAPGNTPRQASTYL